MRSAFGRAWPRRRWLDLRYPDQSARAGAFTALLKQRLVFLDGAMGTMIQVHSLTETQFRGERFADWPRDLRGNNDLLTLTQPHIIAGIHREYLRAGADVVCTNTFNSSPVSQADYAMESLVGELNLAAARLARRVADEVSAEIADDGVGPTWDADRRPGEHQGSGLSGLTERARAAGAEISSGEGPGGKGFRLLVRVPATRFSGATASS